LKLPKTTVPIYFIGVAKSICREKYGCGTTVSLMPRKVVRVYLSIEQKKLLEKICRSLGIDESEALREAFMDYAKSISLITEKVHGKI
jgi:hypothetical protein